MLDLQAYLDRLSDVVTTEDFDAYLQSVQLPYAIVTVRRTQVFQTPDEMRAHFQRFCDGFRARGLTDLVFSVRSVTMLSDKLAIGTYDTHLLRHGQRMADPYASIVTMRRAEADWRAVSTTQAVGHTDWNSRAGPRSTLLSDTQTRLQ